MVQSAESDQPEAADRGVGPALWPAILAMALAVIFALCALTYALLA